MIRKRLLTENPSAQGSKGGERREGGGTTKRRNFNQTPIAPRKERRIKWGHVGVTWEFRQEPRYQYPHRLGSRLKSRRKRTQHRRNPQKKQKKNSIRKSFHLRMSFPDRSFSEKKAREGTRGITRVQKGVGTFWAKGITNGGGGARQLGNPRWEIGYGALAAMPRIGNK